MTGFAVRQDGLGWRAVNSQTDVDAATETFSAMQPAFSAPTALKVYQQTCRDARAATDVTFRRIQEAIIAGRTTASDTVTKSWLDWFYACTIGMTATKIGVDPMTTKPTSYPAGT